MVLTHDDLRHALARPPRQLGSGSERYAAVAAVFTKSLDLLLIRRAERQGDPWSGHVSLPGGHVDPTDEDTLAAAIRETWEEVGVNLDEAEVLGALDDVGTVAGLPPFVVRPWVFLIDRLPELRPNREVARTHVVALEQLQQGAGRSTFTFDHRGHHMTLPCVDVEGSRLWGMTLHMLDDLLHRLDGGGIGMARIPSGGI